MRSTKRVSSRSRALAVIVVGLVLSQLSRRAPAFAQDDCPLQHLPEITVTFIRDRPAVPVGINGQYVFFMLDTGFSLTSVTPAAQARFKLPTDPRPPITSAGSGGKVTQPFVSLERFEFSGLAYANPSFPVAGLDQNYGAQHQNDPPDLFSGVVGGDFLRDYDVEFDFPNNRMRLHRRPLCSVVRPAWTAPYVTVPVRLTTQNTIVVPVQVNGRPLKALFDTGAFALVLKLQSVYGAGIDPASLQGDKMVVTSGAGGLPNMGWIHPLEALDVGGERLPRTNIAVQNFDLPNADMLLGEPYMRSHKIWIAYRSELMFVEAREPR